MRKSAAKLAIFNNTNDTLINGDKLRQEAWNSLISTQRPMFPYHLRLLWSMLMAMMVLPRNLDNVHLYFNLAEISRVPVLTIARFILLSIWFFFNLCELVPLPATQPYGSERRRQLYILFYARANPS